MKIIISNKLPLNIKMDELTRYLKLCKYKKIELEQILNKKIIITENHIKNIDLDCIIDHDFNIINLFEKYGYVFTNNIYILLVRKNGYILNDFSDNIKTDEICKIAVQQMEMHCNLFLKINELTKYVK